MYGRRGHGGGPDSTTQANPAICTPSVELPPCFIAKTQSEAVLQYQSSLAKSQDAINPAQSTTVQMQTNNSPVPGCHSS